MRVRGSRVRGSLDGVQQLLNFAFSPRKSLGLGIPNRIDS
jgi:hypothetical protein